MEGTSPAKDRSLKNMLWPGLKNREAALKTVKDVSLTFLALAALQSVIGFFLLPEMLIDGILLIALSALFYRYKSRIISIVLLLMSVLICVSTFYNKISGAQGGKNYFLAIVALLAGIHAVRSSFVLRRFDPYKGIAPRTYMLRGIVGTVVSMAVLAGILYSAPYFFATEEEFYGQELLVNFLNILFVLALIFSGIFIAGMTKWVYLKVVSRRQ